MQKSYEREIATHIGSESCGAVRKSSVEALTGEPQRAVDLSVASGAALASRAFAAQPERPRPLGSHAAPYHSLAAYVPSVCHPYPLRRMGVVT